MHISFLAKSITFSGQIMASDQLLPNSSRATIYRAIKTRRLPAYKLYGGSYAIYPAELLRAFPSMAQAAAKAAKQSSGSFSGT
jgi:hypothetical protein